MLDFFFIYLKKRGHSVMYSIRILQLDHSQVPENNPMWISPPLFTILERERLRECLIHREMYNSIGRKSFGRIVKEWLSNKWGKKKCLIHKGFFFLFCKLYQTQGDAKIKGYVTIVQYMINENVTGVKNSLWQHFPQYVTANLWTNFSLHWALRPDTSSYTIHNSRATKFPANKISQLNFARESILLQLRENLQVQRGKSDESQAKIEEFFTCHNNCP